MPRNSDNRDKDEIVSTFRNSLCRVPVESRCDDPSKSFYMNDVEWDSIKKLRAAKLDGYIQNARVDFHSRKVKKYPLSV